MFTLIRLLFSYKCTLFSILYEFGTNIFFSVHNYLKFIDVFGKLSPRERVFHGECADLPVCYLKSPFEDTSTFIPMICLIYQLSKPRSLIYCGEKLDHRMNRKLRICECSKERLAKVIL